MSLKTRIKRKLGIKLTTKELLQDIADATRQIPVNHFDIDKWSCGSMACAIGNAINKGLIPNLGLIETHKTWDNKPVLIPINHATGSTQFGAVAEALGIPAHHVDLLFSEEGYYDDDIEKDAGGSPRPTPDDVADAVDAYIARNFKEL